MNEFWRKWIMNGIVAVALLMWFTEAGFFASLIASTIFTVIIWFVGDRWLLPASNNITATLADGILAFFYFWLVADLMDWALSIWELVILAAVLAVVEWIFHRQLAQHERTGQKEGKADFAKDQYATEFGEEKGVEELRGQRQEGRKEEEN